MESTVSSSGGSRDQELHPPLPPGFRFHPTDEELVVHYLKKKAASAPLPVAIIVDIDLYKFDPWELPEKASFGEQEWYFFSPRERKYPNGARPNRAATSGYWKATGTDKPILTSGGAQKVGVKKALVFYGGKPPRGIKTNWIMHEYRLADGGSASKAHAGDVPGKNKASLRLDDWVLCRIYKKNSSSSSSSQRHMEEEQDKEYGPADDMLKALSLPLFSHHVATSRPNATLLQPHKLADGTAASYGALLGHDDHLYEGLLSIHPNHPVPHMALQKPRPESPLPQGSTGSELPLKRGLSSACWNEAECILPSSGKRFQNCSGDNDDRVGDQDDGGGSGGHGIPSMMATLLNQMPQQGAPYNHHHHHSAVLSALGGEGVFRQPYQLHGVNWGS